MYPPSVDPARSDGDLHLADGACHLYLTRAGFGTVEDRMAAVNAELVIEDTQPFGAGSITAVKDEPVCSDDSGRSDILLAGPE